MSVFWSDPILQAALEFNMIQAAQVFDCQKNTRLSIQTFVYVRLVSGNSKNRNMRIYIVTFFLTDAKLWSLTLRDERL
jgi:hypothetical protein